MEPRARAGRHKSHLNFGNELSALLFAYGSPSHPDLTKPIPSSQAPTSLNTNTNNSSTTTSYLPSSQHHLSLPSPTPNTTHPPTSKWTSNTPLPESVRILDEIVTDFIIETCHGAAGHASYAGRQKITAKDFEFVLRKDEVKMGRVREMQTKDRDIKNERKLAKDDDERGGGAAKRGGALGVEMLAGLGEFVGEEGTGKGKGRGRGRRKKRKGVEEVDEDVTGVTLEGGLDGEGEEGDGIDGDGGGFRTREGTEEGDDDGDEVGERAAKRLRTDEG